MPKSSKRRDLPDESELAVNPSVWLRWYEQHLRQVLQEWAQRRRVAREDLELLLFDRSDLERTLKGLPNALSPAERRKLAKLDETLKQLAPAIRAAIPDLAEMRKSLDIPQSHWWWFLPDERTEG
ncbi:MAG: hypothetical protein SLRJCFUN_000081 [Candidatus Fervidibacter sp.]|jgi:hypothetical protein